MGKKGLTMNKLRKAKRILENAPISPNLFKQVSTGKMYYIFFPKKV